MYGSANESLAQQRRTIGSGISDSPVAPSTVTRIQDEQARAIGELEMQIKDLAGKLQPFLYDGPRASAPERGSVGNAAAPMPMLSPHLNEINQHTQHIQALSQMVSALRDAVIR